MISQYDSQIVIVRRKVPAIDLFDAVSMSHSACGTPCWGDGLTKYFADKCPPIPVALYHTDSGIDEPLFLPDLGSFRLRSEGMSVVGLHELLGVDYTRKPTWPMYQSSTARIPTEDRQSGGTTMAAPKAIADWSASPQGTASAVFPLSSVPVDSPRIEFANRFFSRSDATSQFSGLLEATSSSACRPASLTGRFLSGERLEPDPDFPRVSKHGRFAAVVGISVLGTNAAEFSHTHLTYLSSVSADQIKR